MGEIDGFEVEFEEVGALLWLVFHGVEEGADQDYQILSQKWIFHYVDGDVLNSEDLNA